MDAVWRQFSVALQLWKPTEVKRLSDLRIDILKLIDHKKGILDDVEVVVRQQSVPGWKEARVKKIPDIQDEIWRILEHIDAEVREGGLLAGDENLRKMWTLLRDEKMHDLCELSAIPFPLPPDKLSLLDALLKRLRDEVNQLGEVDKNLATLIAKSGRAV